jgi:hypothetical protein
MKILTINCNIVLLGLACLGLLTNATPQNVVITFLLLLVPILNIVLMFGSRVNYSRLTFNVKFKTSEEQKEVDNLSSIYLFMKIVAIILNVVLIGFICWTFISQHPGGSLILFLALFVILTPVLSLITITISRTNKFTDIKRTLIFTGISLGALFLCFMLAMRIWIGQGIKDRINIAKQQYSGIAEDALIAYLSDTTHTPHDRSDIAIGTLGQIRSQKALPILKKLYKNDPEGKTCKYHHDKVLCQYEIHKAIVSIEHKWLGAKEKNWFGSWAGLNK